MDYLHLLAAYGDKPSPWPGLFIGILALLILIGIPILVIRARRRTLGNTQEIQQFYAGITGIRQNGEPAPGEVRLIFHTYSGFLVYAVQRRHDLVLPADQAKIVLDRMFRHNLTRGLLAYMALFIPVLSYVEYRSQARKIAAAFNRGFPMD